MIIDDFVVACICSYCEKGRLGALEITFDYVAD